MLEIRYAFSSQKQRDHVCHTSHILMRLPILKVDAPNISDDDCHKYKASYFLLHISLMLPEP